MRISDYLTEDRSVLLKGDTKSAAINELIDAMMSCLEGITKRQLTESVYKRESLMSTGIGLGIAVPHVRLEGVEDAAIAVGVSREGISDYESIDGEPVRIIVLIVAPQGRHDLYIKLLARIVNLLKKDSLRRKIIEKETAHDIYLALTGNNA